MAISHRAHVQSLLLNPATPVSTGLRELVVLATELQDPTTAAWARQEIDGHPATGPLPNYRKVTAPIIGAAMPNGREVRRQLSLADLPPDRRDEIARLDAALGLHQGIATLEARRTLYAASPDPVFRPGLPDIPELIRLMPARDDGLNFVTLYWDIGANRVNDVLAKIRTAAEEMVRMLAIPYPYPDENDQSEGTLAKVTINRREIARMMRDMQKEFDKHPIQVPIQADPQIQLGSDNPNASTTINNNFGVIFHASADGAQVALNNSGTINQQQNHGDQVAPGFEPLAQAVALVMQGLAKVELTDDDRRDAEEAAAEIVAEVTSDQPNSGKIRRAVNAIKGVLAPIGAGLAGATSAEVQEWARTAIDQLGAAL